jgi:hypothetical protein
MPRPMDTLSILTVLATAALLSAAPAFAEDKPAEKVRRAGSVYRVDVTVREKDDGTTVNSRNYLMLLEENAVGKVRASSRVPIPSEKGFQYLDVGLSIDCELMERDTDVLVDLHVEISDFASPGQEKSNPPLIRSIRSEVKSGIPPGKPTVVSIVDDAASKRRYELEVKATKIS